MNIKFCYRDEIHKTFFPPPNFKSLLEEIKASFGDRLPQNFVLQYKDKDGDLITMSSDLEYSSMLRFDTPVTVTSVKVFIVPSEKLVEEKDASFEVIEASQSFSDACLSEFSLGSKTHSQGCRTPSNNISPLRAPLKSSDRLKSLTFSEGEKDEQGSEEFTSPMFKTSVDFNTESFNQLYQTRAMIVQECMEDKLPSTQDKAVQKTETGDVSGLEEQRPIAPSELDRLESSIVLKEIDKFMNELAVKRGQTQSFTEATKEDAANKVPPYVATAAIQKVYLDYGADRASSYVPVEVQRALGSSVSDSFVQEVRNEYRYDAYGSTSEANQLMTSDKYSVSREVEYGDHHLQGSSAQYEPSYKLSASYQDCYSSQNGLDSSNRSEIYTPTAYKPDEIRPFQMYSYQLMAGMSSSLLFMTKDGQGIAYKTIYLKNTGMKPWKKCYVKPINNTQGKTMEIFNIDITDIALVTLELTGYFNVGIYNSEWKIIHENENGVVETIGEPFNVDFIIEASNIMTTKGDVTSPKFESYSLSMTEEKTKSFLDETFQKETDEEETDGTEEEEDTSLSVSANEEKVQYTYEAAGTYSKEYLEYREKITNKAKEIKKIFPEDTPDEIVRFVMQRPELNFEDLLVAYLEMKDGR